jgi:SSS family solute:Na+ symporter
MHLVDWLMVGLPLAVVLVVAARTKKYTRSVADFMSASRVAGRYLVATSSGEAIYGGVDVIGQFELFFVSGFTLQWWLQANNAVWLFIILSGFIVYRYRESRVMTLAQFFEIRYSKAFRIFAGVLVFVSGLFTYGIYPAVGAHFFIYFCGLPTSFHLFNSDYSTYVPVMLLLLLPGMLLTVMGGQLTIMVLDCTNGIIALIFRTAIAAALVYLFAWSDVSKSLAIAPVGKSLVNPFDTANVSSFNFWYMANLIFVNAYGWQARQVGHGFRSAAINAHEQKMGSILGPWRNETRTLVLYVLGACAFCFLHSPHYAAGAAQVQKTLSGISDPQLQTQLQIPVALGIMLPPVIKGMFASTMLFAMISADCTMMHSWGTILIQDLVVPLRKTQMATKRHLLMLRLSVVGVGLFAFFFSVFVRQMDFILMFTALMASIFMGGAGAAIIGGFYWKRGTTAGAWGGMIAGLSVTLIGTIAQRQWTVIYPWMAGHSPSVLAGMKWLFEDVLSRHIPALNWRVGPDQTPINGQWVWSLACLAAIISYTSLSLLTSKEPFDLDRMLHRGRYSSDPVHAAMTSKPRKFTWGGLIGITPEYTRGDKAISLSLFSYRITWFIIFAVITIWNVWWHPWSNARWTSFWYYSTILFPFVIAAVCTVWFTWGGLRDLRNLFKILGTVERNALDDGTVVGNRNLDDLAAARGVAIAPIATGGGDE